MQKYAFRPYDPLYKDFFKEEKKRIVRLLGSGVAVEHVGSTAIPTLGGKGVVDIVIGVSQGTMEAKKKTLETQYEFRASGSTSDRFFFIKNYPYDKGTRLVHLHLVEKKNPEWKRLVGFRDYMLQHPEVLKAYIRIKKEALAFAQGEGEKYRAYKASFIESILKELT